MATLVIGSSHIKHFEIYLNEENLKDFGLHDCPVIHMFGISGGKISRPDHLGMLKEEVFSINPHHLIVHIGGNDLDSDLDFEEMVFKLIAFLTQCRNSTAIKRITVLQFIQRSKTRELNVPNYNAKVVRANRFLRDQLTNIPNINYWNLKRMKNIDMILDGGGVHFSPQGMWNYYKNFRSAIMCDLNN